MSGRDEADLVRRYLERESALGRSAYWEASISAGRRVTVKRTAEPVPQLAPPARTSLPAAASVVAVSTLDREAESILFDVPGATAGAGEPAPGDSLARVAEEVRACVKCGLSKCRTQAVPGVGTGSSGIVFVGEAPGAEEDRRGEPFVGRAGELLNKILAAMEERQLLPGVPISRDSVYICNVLKCRPPENRNPAPLEIETCSPYLYRQLALLKPRIICCLGKFAAELLVGVKGTIAGLRGKIYRYEGAKLIVTYHPAACLRNPGYKRPVWEDMQLLAREYLASGVR